MKVLLINAINPLIEVETRYPHLGLGYLVSSLRRKFGQNTFKFKIIDKNVENQILKLRPDVISITSVSQNYNFAKEYAHFAKTKDIPVIIGGVHISMLPQSLSSDMDVGCIDEGEKTILELFSVFMEKGKLLSEDLAKIKGIVYKKNGNLIINPSRQQIDNIDEIAFPARDLFKIGKHSYIFSSRGCPYNCVFCASTRFWHKVRFFSAEYVVREIEELVNKYKVNLISFFDDLFIADKQRLAEIVRLLKKKDFYKKIKFTCSARANLVTDEVASLLKEMGVKAVGMGLESGTDKILKYLKGGSVSAEDNKRAIRILRKYNIAANGSFVIGSPSETKKDILDTYNFIKRNPVSLFDTYVLTPYPGTEIWEYAKKRDLVSDNMDWSRLNVNFNKNYNQAIILSETLSRREIIKLYRKFQLLRLFRNTKNVWFTPQILDLPRMLFKMVIEYIDYNLKRLLK